MFLQCYYNAAMTLQCYCNICTMTFAMFLECKHESRYWHSLRLHAHTEPHTNALKYKHSNTHTTKQSNTHKQIPKKY